MTPGDHVVVNGTAHDLRSADGTLLDFLRHTLELTGTKYACGEAACGACSVLLDGALARACVLPLRDVVGRTVTTVEGLAIDGALHRVQQAFVDAGAMQCGFCTPGMIIATVALVDAHPHPSDDEIVQWMAPNLCRCGAYPRITAAIRAAAGSTDQATARPPPPRSYAPPPAIAARPRAPWDLVDLEQRDYFDVLGNGIVAVATPPPAAPGTWAPTGGAWVHVATDGHVTAFTGKVEVGQGTRRALCLLVAEELGVALPDVTLVAGDTDVCPFDVGTFGSLSMPTVTHDLRRAAATARGVLSDGPPPPDARRLAIAAPAPPLTEASAWRVAGTEVPAGDAAAVTGTKRFPSDVRLPGMRFGATLRAPRFGARLVCVNADRAETLPDVTIVVDGSFVGAVAPTNDAAHRALEVIDAQWEMADTVEEAELVQHLRSHPVHAEGWDGAAATEAGDVDRALASAAVCVERTFTTAYIAHAPMETRVAVAEWHDDGRLTVWVGTQRPFGTRRALAEALGLDEARARVVVPDTGAGFGGKHDPEVAIAAARLARAAHAPVMVHWSREEEFEHGYLRPAAVIDVRAAATSDGDLTAWDFLDINAGNAGLAIPYDVPNRRLRFQPADSPLRQGSYRALAATANNFARESVIDEVAHELRVDPLQFRLRHCNDERLATVLRSAAEQFGWDDLVLGAGDGAGLAAGIEKDGRVATCVLVRAGDDELEIRRVVTAFECGAIVDPDNLRNQIVGATIMGLGGACSEAVHFAGGRLLNPRFSEYRVPRFTDVPPIEVVLVDRPDLPPAGAGEAPIITIAPALANAMFRATGRRIRSLPLLADRPVAGSP